MIHQLTSIAAIETVLMRLTLRQKQFIYQIARLEYRIFKGLAKWNEVNILIAEEEKNIKSMEAAIKAAGEGKVMEKLTVWKVKAEYKLFKLNLRKSKIDISKLIVNQSKLEQLKQALITLEGDIKEIESQQQSFIVPVKKENELITLGRDVYASWIKLKLTQEENIVNKSIKEFIELNFKMAS